MEAAKTCYMCDELGSTREHIPPLCCFPKQDLASSEKLFQENHRKGQLLTVPSCRMHNSGKSQDDELILFTTACSESANAVGHAVARYRNAVTRDRNDRFLRWLSHVSDTIIHTDPDGTWRRSGTFIVPIKRYLRALDRVGLGLYYHIHKARFHGLVRSYPRELYRKDEEMGGVHLQLGMIERMCSIADSALKEIPRIGDNPRVFYYQHRCVNEREIVRATFYDGVQIVFTYSPAPKLPSSQPRWLQKMRTLFASKLGDFSTNLEADQGYRLFVIGMFDQDKWAGDDPIGKSKDIAAKDPGR